MTLGLGRDLSCTTSLRTGRIVSGARLVGEAMFRRFTTPRGSLRGGEEEENYGMDLTELVGSVQSAADAAALPGQIELEARKDERLESIEVNVVQTDNGPARSFEISIDGTTADGEFTLVLAVSAVTVELIGLTVED